MGSTSTGPSLKKRDAAGQIRQPWAGKVRPFAQNAQTYAQQQYQEDGFDFYRAVTQKWKSALTEAPAVRHIRGHGQPYASAARAQIQNPAFFDSPGIRDGGFRQHLGIHPGDQHEARELVCCGSGKSREEFYRDGSMYTSPEIAAPARPKPQP